MKLSELINKADAKAKYGDLTVFIQNGDDNNKSEDSVALKWSESIKKLNDIKAEYGDLTVPVKHMITNIHH